MQKLDPYINVDPGTMSPFQHGEVYVTRRRRRDRPRPRATTSASRTPAHAQLATSRPARSTSGDREGAPRRLPGPHGAGDPAHHRRDQGGVRDGWPTEHGASTSPSPRSAARSATSRACRSSRPSGSSRSTSAAQNCLFVHLTLLPYLKAAGELKTKPTQHSVGKLREIGIQPDILICRTEQPMTRRDGARRSRSSATCAPRP